MLKRKVVWRLTVSFLSLVLFVTGCWGSREVENLAIIKMIGLDRITEENVEMWQVSARIFKPELSPKGESTKSASDILVKGTGSTVQEADLQYFKRIPRLPFFGHMNAMVIGEQAARESIEEVLSIHMSHVQDRPRTFLLVTQGEALDILAAEPEMASAISREIAGIMEDKAKKFGTSMGVTGIDFVECLLSPDRDGFLPRISVHHQDTKEKTVEKSIEVEGFGVFRGSKLVGWLNKEQATGLLLLCQKGIKGASMMIPIEDGEKSFTYNLNSSKTKIKPRMEEGKLSFEVTVQVKGKIWETGGIELTAENVDREVDVINETIEEMCMSTIKQAKKLDSEFIGFMQKLHQVNPDAWQEVQENWREAFQEAEIEVVVESTVLNTGKIAKKLEFKE